MALEYQQARVVATAFGWALIGVGALAVSVRLMSLRRRHDTPEMPLTPQRTRLADVCLAALPITAGLAILGNATNSHVLTGAAVSVGVLLVGLIYFLLIFSAGKHSRRRKRAVDGK